MPGSNFLGQPILNLNENLTDAAIKLSKTLLESPIQQIFSFEIGFFFISSTVNTSDKTCVGCDDGLRPSSHPTQVLSDVFTVEEIKKKPISKLNICWIGDSNNVLDSLIAASVKFSFKLSIGCPKKFEPGTKVRNWVKKNKKKIFIYNDPKKAVSGADVIFSDKVISLNDKVNKKKKIAQFKKFKIDKKLMSYAKKDCIFLHCLPRGNEVTDDVFLGKKSHVWQQALNRVHVQKSILLYCFGKLR